MGILRGPPSSREPRAERSEGTARVGPAGAGSHLAALGLLALLTEADGRQPGQVEGSAERRHQQECGSQQPHLAAWTGKGTMRRNCSPKRPEQRLAETAPAQAEAGASRPGRGQSACAVRGTRRERHLGEGRSEEQPTSGQGGQLSHCQTAELNEMPGGNSSLGACGALAQVA